MIAWVPGVPAPQGSKRLLRLSNGKTVMQEMSKKLPSWRHDVRSAAIERHEGPPLEGPVRLRVEFVLPRPKAHFRTGKHAGELKDGAPHYVTKKPDLDKLLRAIGDALTGVVIKDDSQIAQLHTVKIYGERPGAEIQVEEAKHD